MGGSLTSQVDICLWQYMVQQYEAGEEERLLGQGCMKHGLTKGHMTCCSPLEIQRHQELSLMVECHISPMWLFAQIFMHRQLVHVQEQGRAERQ